MDRATLERWSARLFDPLDIASLVVFRVAFGGLMLWKALRLITSGAVESDYIEPPFHFKYYGFAWVEPLPGAWMYAPVIALALLAVGVIVGYRYRLCASLLFVGITYLFLIEQANYLNHMYLVSVLAFMMIFVPAHRARSLDARRVPGLRAETAPAWALGSMRLQIAIVYIYAGIAKLNPDWLQGEPVRMWLAERADFPLIGPLLTEEWCVYVFAYGGLLFDLLVVPLMLWSRTRWIAFAFALGFHLTNAWLFTIGVFPWLGIAATALFFPADWPRRAILLVPPRAGAASAPPDPSSPGRRRLICILLSIWFLAHILVPLRHHLYPGWVHWTEEGHRFSWRMKLRDKGAVARFRVIDTRRGETIYVDPEELLPAWQVSEMSGRPDMLQQFARYLAKRAGAPVEVRADVHVSLNGRVLRRLVDPAVDLAAAPRTLMPADWILPLNEPLRRTPRGANSRALETRYLWESN